jgi:Peptidase family M28
MLDGRLYRAAFIPLLLALAIAGFSLGPRPRPFSSTLAPDAFDGARAAADMHSLASEFPDRRPGSLGDERLARRVASMIAALGNTASGGFSVHTREFEAQTIDGQRTLTTVIAERPGSTAGEPIVILAHRDAAGAGAQAELSGTATLLELARVFATSSTQRTVILVSTSGGSGGNAGAADFAAHLSGPVDAALVLGDLAGSYARKPFTVSFSTGPGSAPVRLQSTVTQAIVGEVGTDPGAPSVLNQLAHLVFPLTVNEQGPLNAAGVPAVLVQVSGQRGPTATESVSPARIENFGRAVLSAVYALDESPDVPNALQTGVLIQRKVLPLWALRLLIGALLLPVLVVGVDGVARLRRARKPVARSFLWVLACSLPFLLSAAFALLLGKLGALGATPAQPVLPSALPFGDADRETVLAAGLVLLLGWLTWPLLMRRLGLATHPDSDAAGLAMLLVLLAVSGVVWVTDPVTVLLLLPALHLWLAVVSPEWRPRRPVALLLLLAGLLPLILLISFYARQLGLGVGAVAQDGLLMLVGGRVGLGGALLWILAFGALAAAAIVAFAAPDAAEGGGEGSGGGRAEAPAGVAVRGPLSYAGPGSLGGTESALRR